MRGKLWNKVLVLLCCNENRNAKVLLATIMAEQLLIFISTES